MSGYSNISGMIGFVFLITIALCGCGNGSTKVVSVSESSAVTSTPNVTRTVISLSDSLLTYKRADTIDFGRIRSGETVLKPLLLKNTGDAPLVIVGLEKTCDCLNVDYPRQPLKPGEEANIELSFDTKRLKGWTFKTIGLRTSLSARPYLLVVTADVE